MLRLSGREEIIAELLNKEKHVRVADLAAYLKVTTETIRRDFAAMEEKGLLTRVHGGAVTPHYFKATEPHEQNRVNLNIDVKRRIARAVAETIIPGESIVIDNGTTCLELAKALADRNDITVITPSLRVANVLFGSGNKLFLLGGWLRKSEASVSGAMTMEMLRNFSVNKVFLSAAGVSVERGITEFIEEDADIKRCAIACAEKVVFMANSAKFNLNALIKVAPIEAVDVLYSDTDLAAEIESALTEKGVKTVKVPAG